MFPQDHLQEYLTPSQEHNQMEKCLDKGNSSPYLVGKFFSFHFFFRLPEHEIYDYISAATRRTIIINLKYHN